MGYINSTVRNRIVMLIYGRLVSDIVCKHEAKVRAKRTGVEEEIPEWGSLHFMINAVQRGSLLQRIDKDGGCPLSSELRGFPIAQERLILEVTTRVTCSEGVVPSREVCPMSDGYRHLDGLDLKGAYQITVNEEDLRISSRHRSKVTTKFIQGAPTNILAGFLKVDGRNIGVEGLSNEDEANIEEYTSELVTPFVLMGELVPQFTRRSATPLVGVGATANPS